MVSFWPEVPWMVSCYCSVHVSRHSAEGYYLLLGPWSGTYYIFIECSLFQSSSSSRCWYFLAAMLLKESIHESTNRKPKNVFFSSHFGIILKWKRDQNDYVPLIAQHIFRWILWWLFKCFLSDVIITENLH